MFPDTSRAKGLRELVEYIGEKPLRMDVNGIRDLDFPPIRPE